MAVLRTPGAMRAYGGSSPIATRVRTGTRRLAPMGALARVRVRRVLALLVYGMSYPLLAVALWTGARDGEWVIGSALVALGVLTSIVGWGMLHVVYPERTRDASEERQDAERTGRPPSVTTFLALYHRIGAIVVLLGSYAVNAKVQGWPAPVSFVGWFTMVWVPLLIAVAIPVACASPTSDLRA
jgi:hypothetical protein